MEIPYTICFCCYQQRVLMLRRNFPPNAQLWNGLGGKLKADETPLIAVRREIQEEAGIDLEQAASLFYAGITTWGLFDHEPVKGMYSFIARLSAQQAEQITSLDTREGLLAWKPLDWVCDPRNQEVVSNIPRFLPPMLKASAPYEYFYEYESEDYASTSFRRMVIRPLPSS
ncbi:NUDIX domain-containing protein [Ktedonosporobacter rubrisoli]|uniref:NUDIX domain-containing protein n=1 Tax=Ktedonosporobacter rubrisoli TaxID=2509675 RepID=A0A4P6JUI8_KTERU|nr:NUDIX domain-containing protein [Ktedonosporobacter rubrisoli]QBD79308.1 NUDIX domain-containing protein [Ktedonosporobacter rubrisoli]